MAFSKPTKIALLLVLVTWLIAGYRCGVWMHTIPYEGRMHTSNSAQSKRLGVFERPLRVSHRSLRHDSLYAIDIEEAYLEKYWVCGEGCKVANDIDPLGGKFIIVRIRPGSDATGLGETYSIQQHAIRPLDDVELYKGASTEQQAIRPRDEAEFYRGVSTLQPDGETGINQTGPVVLLANIMNDMDYGYPVFPLKFYVYGGRFRQKQVLLDSITFY